MQQLTLERSQQTTKKNMAEKAKKDLDEPVKEVLRYIRMENDAILAMKLVTGTPRTIPADTPMKTLATALGAPAFPADAAATVKAMET